MTVYVALLRAVNVGGTAKLAMIRLRELCKKLGFLGVETYIQSGNVLFASPRSEGHVKSALENSLGTELGKPCRVLVRTARELALAAAKNPFAEAAPNHVIVFFLDDALTEAPRAKASDGEEWAVVGRELFVHYPLGSGRSKLKLPAATAGTGRNLNTVRKLAAMAESFTADHG